MVIFAILLSLFVRVGEQTSATDVAYSDFKVMVGGNQVTKVVMRGDVVEGQLYGAKPIGPGTSKSGRSSIT